MAATSIKRKPTGGPGSVTAPTRDSGGSTNHKVTWKNNSADFKDTNDHRIQGFEWWWVIGLKDTSGHTKRWTTLTYRSGNTGLTQVSLSLGNITLCNKKRTSYNDLFPRKGSWYITSLSFNIRGYNSKGKGPTRTATRSYGVSRTPEVSSFEHAEDTGHVSCTIKSDEGNDYRDRLNTRVTIDVEDTRKTGADRNTSIVKYTEATSYTAEYDVEDRFHLTYEQYVRVRVTAQARGYSGPSADASQEIYVSWPNKPVILTEQVSCPSREQLGKVTIPIDLMRTKEHPSTGVRLQVLANVDYERASDIPATEEDNWRDVGVPDDGECTALSVDMSLVIPETEGKRSWVRIKSWNQIEDGFYRYSDYYQLKELYTPAPTAEDDQCAIVSCTSADDGLGAMVTVGYANDSNTGTEVAWSDREDAWTSTDQPDTFEVTWDDDPKAASATEWDKSCTVDVRGLEQGTNYYIKARRYLERDDADTTYSPWSDARTVTPSVAPGAVTLTAPASVPIGSDCAVSWAFDGGTQTAWEIVSDGRVLKSGTDALGSCTLAADELQASADSNGNVRISVIVHTGGGTSQSEESVIVIAKPPTLSVEAGAYDGTTFTAGDVTAQPLVLRVRGSSPTSNVAVTVRAQGVDVGALGQLRQMAGDVMWSDTVTPTWAAISRPASANLLTNDPSKWVNGYYTIDSEGVRWLTTDGARLRTISPVAATDGTTYTAKVDVVPQEVPEEGEPPEEVDEQWQVSLVPVDADGAIIGDATTAGSTTTAIAGEGVAGYHVVLTHTLMDDETGTYVMVAASPSVVGSRVLVQLVEGSSASDWQQADEDADAFEGVILAPDGLDLRDGALYSVTARATDQTGLTSEAAECEFLVAWAHQAPTSYDGIAITPSDVTDEDGIRVRQCSITLAAPTDSYEDTDLYDVWRSTPDGYYLVAEGVEIGGTVTDPYAPYGTGEYGYRIACRTADGDIAWDDFEYELPGKDLRIDFGEEYVELPYNLSVTDAYTKDFESRHKLDGSIDGYWNEGTERKGTYNSDIIRVWEQDKVVALRRLASYAGSCFVRTPDGCAYEANVQVNSMGGQRRSYALAVTIDADEVALTRYVATVEESEEP